MRSLKQEGEPDKLIAVPISITEIAIIPQKQFGGNLAMESIIFGRFPRSIPRGRTFGTLLPRGKD